MSDLISRQDVKEWLGRWEGYLDTDMIARMQLKVDDIPTHPTPSNTLGALDCVERRLVSYKLTDLVNEFEEILSHIREREENDSVCGLCEYDGAYMGQSGDWCNECPGFDKADCFKLKDKYKKEWLELMNTLPSVHPDKDLIHLQREQAYMQGYEDGQKPRKGKWLKAGTRMGIPLFECSLCECGDEVPTVMGKPSYNFCPYCGADMRPQFEEPEINPCRGCEDYDGKGGCKTKGGCAELRGEHDESIIAT